METPLRPNTIFCQQASEKYETQLEEAGGDPRAAAGFQALDDLDNYGGWAPTLDARDARRTLPEKGE